MFRQLLLSDQEWEILQELLESEYRQLPSEIHHTMSKDVQHDLKERMRMVAGILERVRNLAEAA